MQHLEDFLTFKYFISPYMLFIFYYVGALGAPIASWLFASWLKRRYWLVSEAYVEMDKALVKVTKRKHRIGFLLLFLLLFIWMEIAWRMLFEFLMAYLQIREALLLISP